MPVFDELRPTPDRARETLFNWLQPVIEGARCLDLFAGSGALGFEALSRGAAEVTMIENRRELAENLREQARQLQCHSLNIIHGDALQFLAGADTPYDLVFVDPPFSLDLHEKTCQLLLDSGCLQKTALVYLETDGNIPVLPEFEVYKQSKAAAVNFALLRGSQQAP